MPAKHALRRSVVLVLAVTFAMTGCTWSGSDDAAGPEPATGGGTLRVGIICVDPPCLGNNNLDPQENSLNSVVKELTRCCLGRTLLSYTGTTGSDGGAVLHPDIAAALPDVSGDGLTWTFHLKPGLRYGPPLSSIEITAADFVRSFERLLSPTLDTVWAGWFRSFIIDRIEGAPEYSRGRAAAITGIEAPDDHTFRVHLIRPDGDLGHLLAVTNTVPIPPKPSDPGARFGAADGHEGDYGDYLVSSGPYMLAGSEKLDFSIPPIRQSPVAGVTGEAITLVRNPAWDRSTDPLRRAAPDRIVITPVPDDREAQRRVDAGDLDVVLDWEPGPSVVERHGPGGRDAGRLLQTSGDSISFLGMNVAQPPFDDIHVRRAANYVIDIDRLTRAVLRGGSIVAPTDHIAPNTLETELLANYSPFRKHGGGSDLGAARGEMRASKYDEDGDGRCDAAACRDVLAVQVLPDDASPGALQLIVQDFGKLGIHLKLGAGDPMQPRDHVAITLLDGWLKDYPSATPFFPPLFGSEGLGAEHCCNSFLTGASPGQLSHWGYEVRTVPDVDDRIETCRGEVFEAQTRCWAFLDQYMTEEIVPWVPLWETTTSRVVSPRVRAGTLDQAMTNPEPSLDRIILSVDAAAEPAPAPMLAEPPPAAPVSLIPDGVYRMTVTRRDAALVYPGDRPNIDQHSGGFTLTLDAGHLALRVKSPDRQYVDSMSAGTYTGSRDSVVFRFEPRALSSPYEVTLRWSLDGGNLAFVVLKADYPMNEARLNFAGHPWVRAA